MLKFGKIRDEQYNLEAKWRGHGSVLESKKREIAAISRTDTKIAYVSFNTV